MTVYIKYDRIVADKKGGDFMGKKKYISIISLLVIAILLMMSSTIFASTLSKVENLKVEVNGNDAQLTWSEVSNADGYDIFINLPGYGYINIGSVSQNSVSVIGFSENEVYTAKVRAYEYVNNVKQVGEFSGEIDFDTNIETNLGQVTGLNVSVTKNFATISWNSVTNATGYEIYVDIPNYGYLHVGSVEQTSAILTGFNIDGEYGVKVRAYKGTDAKDGYGDFSSQKRFTINNEEDEKIELPKVNNLSVKVSGNTATLDWSNVSRADIYEVYLSNNGSSYELAGTVENSNATISNLDYDTSYKVKVRAYNKEDDVYGEFSSIKSFETESDEKIELGKVRNLTVEDVTKNTVELDWSNVSNADLYEVYLSKNGGSYKLAGTVENSNATVSNLDYDTQYKVKVRAYNEDEDVYGEYSDVKSFTTDEDEKIKLGKVNNLTVEEVTKNTVKLDWSNVSNADLYEVYLSKNGGSYKLAGTVENSNATVSNLEEDTSYRVRVRAYNEEDDVYGDYSNVKSFTTEKDDKIELSQVKNLTADVDGNTVKLDWSNVSNADEYEVYLSKNGGSYKLEGTVRNSNATISGLSYDTTYRVKVRAYNEEDDVYGDYSSIKSFTTDEEEQEELGQVKNLTVENVNGNTVKLDWSNVSNADEYEIYLSKNGGSYKREGTVRNSNATISGLSYDTTYRVKVRAYNEDDDIYGAYSSIKSFTTDEKEDIDDESDEVGKVTGVKVTVTGTNSYLYWNSVPGAVKYEIKFTVPGYGETTLWSEGPGRAINGLTNKTSNYTAKVRAYKYVNGRLVAGEYSDIIRFHGN